MVDVEAIRKMIIMAVKAYDHTIDKLSSKKSTRHSLEDMLKNATKELDCENCHGKDECELKKGVEEIEKCDTPIET